MAHLLHVTATDLDGRMSWTRIVAALKEGHRNVQPVLSDQFLKRGNDTLLSRAAWIDGLGIGVKSVSVLPENPAIGLPTVQGLMVIFEDTKGQVKAVVDSDVVTYWKTVGDSLLGAKLLARENSRTMLILGAGVVAESLVRGYCEIFPGLDRIMIWNRTAQKAKSLAEKLASEGFATEFAPSLEAAGPQADMIATATMSQTPILKGGWVQPGTHVDLIGAFRSDMREADDDLLLKARLFVDSRETTIHHIGELMIPIADGTISADHVLADHYELVAGYKGRTGPDDITVFKNGGGAHLDLMTANALLDVLD